MSMKVFLASWLTVGGVFAPEHKDMQVRTELHQMITIGVNNERKARIVVVFEEGLRMNHSLQSLALYQAYLRQINGGALPLSYDTQEKIVRHLSAKYSQRKQAHNSLRDFVVFATLYRHTANRMHKLLQGTHKQKKHTNVVPLVEVA